MQIVLTDHQQSFSLAEKQQVFDRIRFAMARFAYRIDSIWIDLSFQRRDSELHPACNVTVKVEDRGIVTVHRMSRSLAESVSMAADALEPLVAGRADWRAWFSMSQLSGRLSSIGKRVKSRFVFLDARFQTEI